MKTVIAAIHTTSPRSASVEVRCYADAPDGSQAACGSFAFPLRRYSQRAAVRPEHVRRYVARELATRPGLHGFRAVGVTLVGLSAGEVAR